MFPGGFAARPGEKLSHFALARGFWDREVPGPYADFGMRSTIKACSGKDPGRPRPTCEKLVPSRATRRRNEKDAPSRKTRNKSKNRRSNKGILLDVKRVILRTAGRPQVRPHTRREDKISQRKAAGFHVELFP